MHIPDAYLSPITQLSTASVVVPLLAIAVRKTRNSLTTKQIPLVSVGAAFCFAIQMFNIPAIGGTSAHALGTVLLAILLGPWAAIITMTLTLAVQALFFGDGGILSLGVNAFDMAIVPAFIGHGIFRLISRNQDRRLAAAAVAAYSGTAIASLSAGLILGLQPILSNDGLGHARYFPFGWSISVPAMVYTHLLIAAPAEAIITVFALAYLWQSFPDLVDNGRRTKVDTGFRLNRVLAFVLVLTPIGLLAGGGAWGEWDAAALKKLAGYVPSGVANSKEIVHPLLPGYALPNLHGQLWEIAGYILSALAGAILVTLACRSVFRRGVGVFVDGERRIAPERELPAWLAKPNPAAATPGRSSKPWIESVLLRMRSTVEETVATEKIARSPGLLQNLNGTAKALLVLSGLVLAALIALPAGLFFILILIGILAAASRIPLRTFFGRLISAVAFFGLLVAAPLSLAGVTPGKPIGGVGPLVLTDAGVHMATLILLRIACGIGITLLWTLTTRWNELVGGLRRLGLPALFCTGITLTYRYLFVTIETLQEMVTARRSRQSGPIDKQQSRVYAGTGVAILFGKSHAFTEEVHMAMRSRSFDTGTGHATKPRWSRADAVAVVSCILLFIVIASLKVAHIV